MSEENVALIRKLLADAAAADFEAALGVYAEDSKLYPRPSEPGVRHVYTGADGLMEYMVNWFSQWDDYTFAAIEFIDGRDRVLAVVKETGHLQRTGIELEQEFSHGFTVANGKVVEWRMYGTHEDALEDLGLSG